MAVVEEYQPPEGQLQQGEVADAALDIFNNNDIDDANGDDRNNGDK